MIQIKSALQFLNDFADVLLEDDKKDIGMMISRNHPYPHHYHYAVIMKTFTSFGIKLMDVAEKLLYQEEVTNKHLRDTLELQTLLKSHQEFNNSNNAANEERQRILREYINKLKSINNHEFGRNDNSNGTIYAGNLDQITVSKKKNTTTRIPNQPALPANINNNTKKFTSPLPPK